MNAAWMGLVVGGLVPAVGYALFALWAKLATQDGIGAGPFLVAVGLATTLVGAVFSAVLPAGWNLRSAGWSAAAGAVWAIGSGLVSFALLRWGVPIAKLNPLYNTNTLLAVAFGLVLFGEWRQVEPVKLLLGAGLILVGSVLVSRA